jgi:hypothetical protein
LHKDHLSLFVNKIIGTVFNLKEIIPACKVVFNRLKCLNMETLINCNMKFKELNDREKIAINGGLGIGIAIVIGLTIAAGQEILSDWDNFVAGLSGEKEVK